MPKKPSPQSSAESVQDLVEVLCSSFPEFRPIWETDSAEHDEYYPASCHSVFMSFNPEFDRLAARASESQLKSFADFLNNSVQQGGWAENLVSTAFLEHLHQISRKDHLSKYLSDLAKAQQRA